MASYVLLTRPGHDIRGRYAIRSRGGKDRPEFARSTTSTRISKHSAWVDTTPWTSGRHRLIPAVEVLARARLRLADVWHSASPINVNPS